MNLTEEQIAFINKYCPEDCGIYSEPFGIPDKEKRLVIHHMFATGGMEGGNCWGGVAHSFTADYEEGIDGLAEIIQGILRVLIPEISFLDYAKLLKKTRSLIHSSDKSEWGYYGNYIDSTIEYIVLDEFYEKVKECLNEQQST